MGNPTRSRSCMSLSSTWNWCRQMQSGTANNTSCHQKFSFIIWPPHVIVHKKKQTFSFEITSLIQTNGKSSGSALYCISFILFIKRKQKQASNASLASLLFPLPLFVFLFVSCMQVPSLLFSPTAASHSHSCLGENESSKPGRRPRVGSDRLRVLLRCILSSILGCVLFYFGCS